MDFADHVTCAPDLGTLNVFGIDSCISDMGGRHADNLAKIGGIRQDFLITRERGIEDGLAIAPVRQAAVTDDFGGDGSSEEFSREFRSVLKHENALTHKPHDH